MSLTYQTLYFNQTLDHLQPWSPSSPIYSEKYLLNDEHYGGGPFSTPDCPGPIFMYAGNEGPVEGFWPGNGFMQDLAVKYNGLLLFPEQRYYGTSQPTDTSDPSSPWLLTTQQVLEDYVNLLSHVKAEYSAESCPTIAFGGSYGGTLAALLRSAYPFAVQGALASSSEMGYYDVDAWESQDVDEFTFADIVSAQYAKQDGCLENIWAATDAIEAASPSDLLEAFNLCDEGALKPNKSSVFIYGLEGLAQLNYPYAIGDMPAWPVTAACGILGDASSPLLERAAKATAVSIDYSLDGDCLPSFEEGPGNIPGDGPGLTSWGYQSCTECLHEFSSRGREDGGIRPFVYEDEIKDLTDLCASLYGDDIAPNTHTLTDRYGGYQIARGTSNTIFSRGLLDPWSGGAIKEGGADASQRGVHFFAMENGAHHLDLRGANAADPKDVTETRMQEEEIIVGWIQAAMAAA